MANHFQPQQASRYSHPLPSFYQHGSPAGGTQGGRYGYYNPSGAGSSGRGPAAAARSILSIPCNLCGQLFNSQKQASAHFNGAGHKRMVELDKESQILGEWSVSFVVATSTLLC